MRARELTTVLRRLLIVSHRWLGIPMSLLFVIWFASGIVMIYAGGMPQLDAQRRLEQLAPLDLGAVRLSPLQAAEQGGVPSGIEPVSLLSVQQRPAYRFGDGAGAITIFADDGSPLEPLDPQAARLVASRFLGAAQDRVQYLGQVREPDQWTLTHARELPLHKFGVDDADGTEVYVSAHRAEVVLETTRRSRMLAWLGTIPHWFYFTPLRVNQPAWYWAVVSASAVGCVLAVLGLSLGITQFRRSRPFSLSASIRYRGWMRWHYVLGVVFGIFALTWVFSGLMSMEPFGWTQAQGLSVRRDALSGGPIDLARFGPLDRGAWSDLLENRTLKELELLRIQDQPYYVARTTAGTSEPQTLRRERLHQPYAISGRAEGSRLLVNADTTSLRPAFAAEPILERLEAALPRGVRAVEHALLHEYDAYYYSRGGQAPLPVLRVKYDDPLKTWIYVDPQLSRIVAEIHRYSRIERWLFNGLHSLDFAFWYQKRPLWDIGMILLSLGALVTSAIGLVFGIKRVARSMAR